MARFAEDANYFTTTVHHAISQGEITELLEHFGAEEINILSGTSGGRYAIAVRFQWEEKTYRFAFTPLVCRDPEKVMSYGGKRRTSLEQSKYQMGRIAVNFVKAVLTAAEAEPKALFGFMELPGVKSNNGMPVLAGDVNMSKYTGKLLSATVDFDTVDGEVTEVK